MAALLAAAGLLLLLAAATAAVAAAGHAAGSRLRLLPAAVLLPSLLVQLPTTQLHKRAGRRHRTEPSNPKWYTSPSKPKLTQA